MIDRVETGLLSFGNDMTLRDNPIEAGLDRFFKMGKAAEYLGQKALEQIAESGPDKRMVRLVVPVRPSPTRAGPTPWKWAKQSARESHQHHLFAALQLQCGFGLCAGGSV